MSEGSTDSFEVAALLNALDGADVSDVVAAAIITGAISKLAPEARERVALAIGHELVTQRDQEASQAKKGDDE